MKPSIMKFLKPSADKNDSSVPGSKAAEDRNIDEEMECV